MPHAGTEEHSLSAAGPEAGAVREQVERILQSSGFRSAGVLRHLLGYLADKCLAGEADTLKEYTIGLDALGKPASFDPRQESVVRMHTARLRQKLADYYRGDGAADPIFIDLPKGGFRLTFEHRQLTPPALELQTAPVPRFRTRELVLAAALVLALIALAAAFRKPAIPAAESEAAAWTPELRELWAPLLSPGRRIIICISTPLFVNVPGFGAIRDSSVNDWDQVDGSQKLSSVERALGAGMSEPTYEYTDVGTANGAFQLGQFLTAHGRQVTVTTATALSWREIAQDNVVFLGPPSGIHQTEDLPGDLSFVLDPEGIRNLEPRPGEPALIADLPGRNGEESGLTHALITRLPSTNGRGAILLLSGNQASGVMGGVQAFTNPALAKSLVERLRGANGRIPDHFQAVLDVKSMDQVPIEVTYLLHRQIGAPSAASH